MIKSIIFNIFKIIITLSILSLGIGGYIWLKNTAPNVEVKKVDEKIFNVSASNIILQDFEPLSFSYGLVYSSRNASLTFPMFGKIKYIAENFISGSFIKKDEVLVKIDDFDQKNQLRDLNIQLDQLNYQRREINDEILSDKTQLKELQEQLTLKKKLKNRVSNMVSNNASTENDLDNMILSVSNTKSMVLTREQNITRLNHKLDQLELSKNRILVSIQRNKKKISDTILTAPFDGSLRNVNIAFGENVQSGKSLGTLTDLNSLEVSFSVPAEIFSNATSIIGKKARIVWQQGTKEVSSVFAVISRIEVNVNPQDGGGKLYAKLPGVKGSLVQIPPGAYVKVEYPIGVLKNVISLPEEALYEGNFVYLIENGRAKKVNVNVIFKEPGRVYIRGILNSGDKVITSRLAALGDGVKVKIRQ